MNLRGGITTYHAIYFVAAADLIDAADCVVAAVCVEAAGCVNPACCRSSTVMLAVMAGLPGLEADG